MARSLLSFRLGYLVLLASASSMSACIIPVAPNFQDPPSVPDSGPFLSGFSPKSFGELVTVPVPGGQVFSANVTDQNVIATLFVRWAVDYPPLTDGVTYSQDQAPIQPSSDRQVKTTTITQLIDCSWIRQPVTSTHQVELIVADSDFVDSSTFGLPADRKLDTTRDPNGLVAYALWPIVISCPASTTSNTSSQ
jgi:hypothetical protein